MKNQAWRDLLDNIHLMPSGPLITIAKPMTRTEIVSRRFEAARMRWPEKTLVLFQQEALIHGWPPRIIRITNHPHRKQ